MNRRSFLAALSALFLIPFRDGDDPNCTNCPHTRSRHQYESTIGDTHCLVLDCDCEHFGGTKIDSKIASNAATVSIYGSPNDLDYFLIPGAYITNLKVPEGY